MLGCPVHGIEYRLNKVQGYRLMKQVAHGIDENRPWLGPFKGQFNQFVVQGNLESVAIAGVTHGFEPPGHSLGVTVLAPRADLATAGDRVPGSLGPFN